MTRTTLDIAIEELQRGGVVAIPTETVYGLAAAINSRVGIEKIFSVKQRPFFDPLIVHVSSKKMAESLTTEWSPVANFLAEQFWPGPLTLVLPKKDSVDSMITSGLPTVGIRMPNSSLTLSLIEKLNCPLAAPSANRFGRTSPTCVEHVRAEFPNETFPILDGGPCEVGLESTVLSIQKISTGFQLSILRKGHIKQSDLEIALAGQGFQISFVEQLNRRESPGQMKHHYMPEIPLVILQNLTMAPAQVLAKISAELSLLPDEVDGVQIRKPKKITNVVELILPTDAALAARRLYALLRETSEGVSPAPDLILFRKQPIHDGESWFALMDRLTKAASLILQ